MTDTQYLYLAKLIAKDFQCEIQTSLPELPKIFHLVCFTRNARGELLARRSSEKEIFEFLLTWVS